MSGGVIRYPPTMPGDSPTQKAVTLILLILTVESPISCRYTVILGPEYGLQERRRYGRYGCVHVDDIQTWVVLVYFGQFFSKSRIGNVQHIGIHVFVRSNCTLWEKLTHLQFTRTSIFGVAFR